MNSPQWYLQQLGIQQYLPRDTIELGAVFTAPKFDSAGDAEIETDQINLENSVVPDRSLNTGEPSVAGQLIESLFAESKPSKKGKPTLLNTSITDAEQCETTQHYKARLSIWQPSSQWLVMHLSQPNSALTGEQKALLVNMCSAVFQPNIRMQQPEVVDWPLSASSQPTQTAFKGYIYKLLSHRKGDVPLQGVWLLGNDCCNLLLEPNSFAIGQAINTDHGQFLCLPSLDLMLEQPSYKRVAWQLLKGIRQG